MKKHSPGPWQANGTAIEQSEHSPAHVIGHVSSTTIEDESEIEANARLIAESPMMHEFLETIRDQVVYPHKVRFSNFYALAREAEKILARIEGADRE